MDFLQIGIKDIVDIFLVAFLLYNIYRLMKASRSVNVFTGIIVFAIVWLIVSEILEMRLLGGILNQLVNVGAISLIVLFQEDIRKFLSNLGSQQRMNRWRKILGLRKQNIEGLRRETIMPVVMACMSMSRQKIGALIIFERENRLDDIVASGDTVDAQINQRLIENIFFKNSPLHDGAMIISNKRIKAAGCILPVSHDLDIPKELGLRHRAAMGIAQESDAIAIVVSEETGRITVAHHGKFKLRVSAEELESILTQ